MNSSWVLVIDICLLSAFLGIGTFLKRKVPIFKKFLIPNAIIAGFVGLVVGPQVLNLVPKGALLGGNLEQIVYHAMAIGFISLALKERTREKGVDITNTGIGIVSTYLMQAILGFSITIFMAFTFIKDLFPSFGLLLPLAFGQGPGQASSIGGQWAQVLSPEGIPGIVGGANIGLSIAAIGFLWACIGGVPLINYFVKKRGFVPGAYAKKNPEVKMVNETDRADDIPLSESIDRLTVQIFLIGIVYLLTWLVISGIQLLIKDLGTLGLTVSNLLWGFHFIIGAVIALGLRRIFDKMKEKKIMNRTYPNNFLLQRIAGASFDYMVTAGITAISIAILGKYWIPTITITTIGMVATMLYVYHLCKRIYSDHVIESTVAMYGMLTGTISTGLALLREVDPEFKTPVAKHLVLGSGVGLLFGFPLLILLGVPITGYTLGNNMYYLYTMIGFVLYFIFLLLTMRFNKKRALRKENSK